jgi:hypothetical protein
MASKKQTPPVPPENRSPKGTGADPQQPEQPNLKDSDENLEEKGRQGNIRQNTRNQDYQQDR